MYHFSPHNWTAFVRLNKRHVMLCYVILPSVSRNALVNGAAAAADAVAPLGDLPPFNRVTGDVRID